MPPGSRHPIPTTAIATGAGAAGRLGGACVTATRSPGSPPPPAPRTRRASWSSVPASHSSVAGSAIPVSSLISAASATASREVTPSSASGRS